jgi:hypothetical protein
MASQNCSQCNAPLSLGPPGTVVLCRYCGTENTIDDPLRKPPAAFPHPPTHGAPPAQGRRAGPRVALLVLFFGAVIALVLGIKNCNRSGSPGSSGGSGATAADRLPLSRLAALSEDGWVEIEPPSFLGTLEAFQPSANLEWLLTIGRAWSNDVVLTRLDLAGVTRDGKLDLRSEGEPDFDAWFVSPARVASAENLAQVSNDVPATGLRLWIHAGKIEVMQNADRLNDHARAKGALDIALPGNSSCTLARVLEIAIANGLPRRPQYDLDLEPHAGGRWAWQVRPPPGDVSDRPPSVLLDSCKIPAELPEPGAEAAPDDGMHEPFDWSTFRPVAGCECPGDPPLRLAVLRRGASFVKNRDGIEGSFGLAWILRAGDATPWRLPVDDRETAPSSVLWGRIEDSMAMACDGDRVFVVADGHASAWSRSGKRTLWSVPVDVPPTATEAVPTELPVEPGDFSLVFRCVPAGFAGEVLSVPLADGTTLRLSAADGSTVPDAAAAPDAADAGEAEAVPDAGSAPDSPPPGP